MVSSCLYIASLTSMNFIRVCQAYADSNELLMIFPIFSCSVSIRSEARFFWFCLGGGGGGGDVFSSVVYTQRYDCRAAFVPSKYIFK